MSASYLDPIKPTAAVMAAAPELLDEPTVISSDEERVVVTDSDVRNHHGNSSLTHSDHRKLPKCLFFQNKSTALQGIIYGKTEMRRVREANLIYMKKQEVAGSETRIKNPGIKCDPDQVKKSLE